MRPVCPAPDCPDLSDCDCALCGQPASDVVRAGSKLLDDTAQGSSCISFEEHVLHRSCVSWAGDSQIRALGDDKELRRLDEVRKISVRDALEHAKFRTCNHCKEHGASVACASLCGRWLHRHCLDESGCDYDEDDKRATCVACLRGRGASKAGSLPASGAVKASNRAAGAALKPARATRRPLRGPDPHERKPHKRGSVNAIASGRKRPQRQAAKRKISYAEPPLELDDVEEAAGDTGDASDASGMSDAEVHDSEDDDDNEFEDEVEADTARPSRRKRQAAPRAAKSRGRTRPAAASGWGSESEEEDADSGSDDDAVHKRRRPSPTRKSQRKRVKTITFDEEVAQKAAQAAAVAAAAAAAAAQQEQKEKELLWEDQACMRCGSKEDGPDSEEGLMLLCDGCNKGMHMRCMKPPLEEVPEGSWHCPDCASRILCEVCSTPVVKSAPGMGRLVNCGGQCGARCHSACLSEEDRSCPLCARGFTTIKTILGCRHGRNGAGELEYYIRWAGRPFRDACWVGATTVRRMSKERVHGFHNKHRGALQVQPEVQDSWSQVGCVVAVRNDGEEVLVKWKGLDYGECTWEAADSVDAKFVKEYRQRLGLRAAEKANGKDVHLQLPLQLQSYVPAKLVLKDYQIDGVNWLLGKLQERQNVILGDEMGLGKTIQAATLLAAAQREHLTAGPALIVAPLSTIGSWERELAKWAPGLAVLPYIGGQAAREIIQRYEMAEDPEEVAEAEARGQQLRGLGVVPRFRILLTTFELASKDNKLLRKFSWSAQIIDEGHRLKSESSLVSNTLSALSADWRCIMTGTPLQNELNELYCLLAFLEEVQAADIERLVEATPDPAVLMLGASTATALQVDDASDEENEQDHAAYARKLHSFLAPRMLRRLKHNVASLSKELPPKITRKVACRLSPLQRQLYVDILARNFAALNGRAKGSSKNNLNNVLMNLRKACDHPFLFEGQEPPGLQDEEAARLLVACSGKMAMLAAMLPRLLADGHRVLIFSQLKGVLTLLEDMLHDFPHRAALPDRFQRACSEGGDEEAGPVIPYFRLDGETQIQERQRQIDLFNTPGCEVSVFLMSTRAGGLGINLQSADTIIIFDSDFNPFADLQAEGRAHRLGQQQTVMVYQLFSAATVEERILANAAKKRKLEAVVCAHMGHGAGAELSSAELRACLTHDAANLMVGADGDTGEVEIICDADLARLLDRSELQPGDEAYCADELLGEEPLRFAAVQVGQGKVLELAAQAAEAASGAAASQGADDGAASAFHAAEEARMLQLLAERAAMLEHAKLEAAGRGKRARRQINYAAESPSIALSGGRRRRVSGSAGTTPLSSPDSALRPAHGAAGTPMSKAAIVLRSDSDSEDSDAWMSDVPKLEKVRKQLHLKDAASDAGHTNSGAQATLSAADDAAKAAMKAAAAPAGGQSEGIAAASGLNSQPAKSKAASGAKAVGKLGAARKHKGEDSKAAAVSAGLKTSGPKQRTLHDSASSKPPRSPSSRSPSSISKHKRQPDAEPLLRSPLGEVAWLPSSNTGSAKARKVSSSGKVSLPSKSSFATAKRKSAEQAAAEFEAWG